MVLAWLADRAGFDGDRCRAVRGLNVFGAKIRVLAVRLDVVRRQLSSKRCDWG